MDNRIYHLTNFYLNGASKRSKQPNWADHVLNICDRGQEVSHDDLVSILRALIHGNEDSSCTHGVSGIVDTLLSSACGDVVNHGRDIIFAILVPTAITIFD